MNNAGHTAHAHALPGPPKYTDFRRPCQMYGNKGRNCWSAGRVSLLAGHFFRWFPEEMADAGTIPKDCEVRQGGMVSRIKWSTVSARTPNIKCPNSLACPRIRTWRAPNSSLRCASVRSTPERIRCRTLCGLTKPGIRRAILAHVEKFRLVS